MKQKPGWLWTHIRVKRAAEEMAKEFPVTVESKHVWHISHDPDCQELTKGQRCNCDAEIKFNLHGIGAFLVDGRGRLEMVSNTKAWDERGRLERIRKRRK